MGESSRSTDRVSWDVMGRQLGLFLEKEMERACCACPLSIAEKAECMLHARCSIYVKVWMDSGEIAKVNYRGPMFRFEAQVKYDRERLDKDAAQRDPDV